MGMRKKDDDDYGKFEIPGGKVEGNESIREGLNREVREEVGLDISESDIFSIATPRILDNGMEVYKYYVSEYRGEIVNMETEKVYSWNWLDLDYFALLGMIGKLRMPSSQIKEIIEKIGEIISCGVRPSPGNSEMHATNGNIKEFFLAGEENMPQGFTRVGLKNDDNQCVLHSLNLLTGGKVIPAPGQLVSGLSINDVDTIYSGIKDQVAIFDNKSGSWKSGNEETAKYHLLWTEQANGEYHCEPLVRTVDIEKYSDIITNNDTIAPATGIPELEKKAEVIQQEVDKLNIELEKKGE
jgi:hypothetical protein